MKKAPQEGFTLIELVITVGVIAVLAAITVPNMQTFAKNARLTNAANDTLHSFQVARSEAIKRQKNVVVCASADGSTCSYGSFATGWIVFEDTDGSWQKDGSEAVLETHQAIESSVTAFSLPAGQDGIQAYGPSGFALPGAAGKTPTTNISFCDDRGNQVISGTDSTARAVLIDSTGRVKVSKNTSDVSCS